MKHLMAVMAFAAALSGCATPYQARGLSGGFKDTQLAPDQFVVLFTGNEHTPPERVLDFALLRSAELVLQNGLTHFVILESANQSRSSTYVAPGTSHTTGTVQATGNFATYSSTTTSTPAQVYNTYEPGLGLMIRGYSYQPDQANSFDAAFIVKTMKAKYKLK
jgi:hypothetical protein